MSAGDGLDYAIHVCFANARTGQDRPTRRQDRGPDVRDRVTVYEPEDWDNRIRRYYDEHPAACTALSSPSPADFRGPMGDRARRTDA